jgi:mannose-1-phosphate guanylyltransferase
VHTAAAVARDGWLVTLGIQPTFASSAYGYIHQAGPLDGYPGVALVDSFVEKPSAEVAHGYLASGGYRWNAGMFVVRPSVLLDLLAEWDPEFAANLRAIAANPESIGEIWPALPKIAVDNAVAEPAAAAGRVAVVAADFGWDDVGDFDSLAALLDAALTVDNEGPTVLGDRHLVKAIDSSGLVVPNSGRVVAVVGLEDVVVVDTPDAVLVTTRERAQQVKQLVVGLQKDGAVDLT